MAQQSATAATAAAMALEKGGGCWHGAAENAIWLSCENAELDEERRALGVAAGSRQDLQQAYLKPQQFSVECEKENSGPRGRYDGLVEDDGESGSAAAAASAASSTAGTWTAETYSRSRAPAKRGPCRRKSPKSEAARGEARNVP
eukprot:g4403.t1